MAQDTPQGPGVNKPATAPVPVALQQAPVVLSESDTVRFIRERSRVEGLDNAVYHDGDKYALPAFSDKKVKDSCYQGIGNRVEYERPATIEDVNPGQKYLWLTQLDMTGTPDFMRHIFIATRENHGEGKYPPGTFNSDGVCMRGKHFLCFTSETFYNQMKNSRRQIADARLGSFKSDSRGKVHSAGTSKVAMTQELSGSIQQG